MREDEILESESSMLQMLDTLRDEHTNMISTFVDKLDKTPLYASQQSTQIIEEKILIVTSWNDTVQSGISEVSLLIQLSNYLQTVDEENARLRDELTKAQEKLQDSEENSAQIEIERDYLKCVNELREFEEDLPIQQLDASSHEPIRADQIEDSLFPDKYEYQFHSTSTIHSLYKENCTFI
jgi:flagellar biosynthesis chaperone FliJ